jgi:hypothetical protein
LEPYQCKQQQHHRQQCCSYTLPPTATPWPRPPWLQKGRTTSAGADCQTLGR